MISDELKKWVKIVESSMHIPSELLGQETVRDVEIKVVEEEEKIEVRERIIKDVELFSVSLIRVEA